MANNKFKLAIIVGTRPEIIRLSEVIKKCDKVFDMTLIHTGQNWDYTLNEIFFEELGVKAPDKSLDAVGENLGQTLGTIIAKSYEALVELSPDGLLVLGDTNSALSTIAAKRLKIPIFHMEAGNRCFDQNVPEEINRKIVDHISDVNLTYTEHSRRHLFKEGLSAKFVFVTGSPMTEVLQVNKDKIENSNILKELKLTKNKYILLSSHREENIDSSENLALLKSSIDKIVEEFDMPLIYSVHPRTQKKFEQEGFSFDKRVIQMKPFGFFDYNKLQKEAFVVLSDSGTLSEESALLKFPGVLLRTSTERPEVLDKGSIVIGGLKEDNLVSSIYTAVSLQSESIPLPDDYKDTNISNKIARVIQSYIPIVNRDIWRK